MKAIIPAAGLGTRFLPATKAIPKEMLPVVDKPTIQYVVEEALAAEADEVIIVTNANKAAIAAHFSPDEQLVAHLEASGKADLAVAVRHAGSLPVSFVEQAEARGLGHAVLCAAEAVASTDPPSQAFYVLLGDVIVPEARMLPRMCEISKTHNNASVIAVLRVPRSEVDRFGIIAGEPVTTDIDGVGDSATDTWRVNALVEKPPVAQAPSDLAIFGRYLLSPRVMQILEHTAVGAGGEIQLTDALVELLATEEIYALIIDPKDGLDVGTIPDWIAANERLAR
ncbi:MAG: NTP transferase domain-containing protein, partial [Coriobacteriales bacterium]|jgi:UTP--glucose-1-phosphate uridylyltransferase|nr:NTP transferase domain-containing protein [Coriobacteriales bacterium]